MTTHHELAACQARLGFVHGELVGPIFGLGAMQAPTRPLRIDGRFHRISFSLSRALDRREELPMVMGSEVSGRE